MGNMKRKEWLFFDVNEDASLLEICFPCKSTEGIAYMDRGV